MMTIACVLFLIGSPLETLLEFQRWAEPDPKLAGSMGRLRDRYAAELEEKRPEEGREAAYYATLPYYVLALAVMDDALLVLVDYGATEDEEQAKALRREYLVLRAELEILSEEIQRLEKELSPP